MDKKHKILAFLSILSIYFYIFMEWLFFITKPSFISTLSIYESISIITISPLPVVVISILLVLGFWVISLIIKNTLNHDIFYTLARIIPAVVLSSSIFILIDNFTYSLFSFGMGSIESLWRLVYGALFLFLFGYIYRLIYRIERGQLLHRNYSKFIIGTMILLAISFCGVIVAYALKDVDYNDWTQKKADVKKLPNILIIGTDGLNADHMSAYGYHRDTTPFIKNFMKNALVSENNFPNAGSTGGSVVSMLTGKLPTKTKVIYPPDILRGEDAYQHLPGILRNLGYKSIELSVRHHGDSHDLNMKNSFDFSNFREIKDYNIRFLPGYFNVLFGSEIYFLGQIYERIEERLSHAFGQQKMVNSFAEVTKANRRVSDLDRLKALLNFMNKSGNPLFAHVHLMGTHGNPKPIKRVFSISHGQNQIKTWTIDLYDDAILSFDIYFKLVVKYLLEGGKIKNTVIVIYSDHGIRHSANVRVPLIIYFPDKSRAGTISKNTQNLDIALTLLDYIGLEIPKWMDGQSLITSNIDRLRPIISVSVGDTELNEDGLNVKTDSYSPFFGLGEVSLIICNKVFKLNLKDNVLSTFEVAGHTAPCNYSDIPDDIEARRYIVNHLKESEYDISSIQLD